jgi:hypothetical protein
MSSVAANTLAVGDVFTNGEGTVKLVRAADPLANEPAATTALSVKQGGFPWYRAFYPNAQNVSLSNR